MIALSMLAMTSSCGSEAADYISGKPKAREWREPHIEEEFMKYVDKFDSIYHTNVGIMMEWGDLTNNMVGVCKWWDDGHREIQIDRQAWPSFTDNGKEELIFHELGHCILNLPHNENRINIGGWRSVPQSIMYPTVFGDSYFYEDLKDYYYNQLSGK